MKILLVSSFLPYPLFSGGHVRLYNIIKELSKKHEIYLICERRKHQTREDIVEVKKFCKNVIVVERIKQWSWNNILKTGFSRFPFLLTGHKSLKMQEEINTFLKIHKVDLIHVETFYVMQNLPETKLPIVLVEHNVEYLVYKRFADQAPLILRPLLYFDIFKLKFWEQNMWKKATKLVAVSEIDKKIMEKKKRDVDVVSNGVDLDNFRIRNQEGGIKKGERRILFIGDFRWMENRDALSWILKEIWPKIKLLFWSEGEARAIKSHNKLLKLWVVGKNIPQGIKLLGDESVIFDENAPSDTSLIYQKSDVLLAPIRVGGGTSFKILEAMASGIPVVTTPLGNAVGAKENEEILIANNTNEFSEKIINVLKNQQLYEKIIVKARKLIEDKYDWRRIVARLENVYKSVI